MHRGGRVALSVHSSSRVARWLGSSDLVRLIEGLGALDYEISTKHELSLLFDPEPDARSVSFTLSGVTSAPLLPGRRAVPKRT